MRRQTLAIGALVVAIACLVMARPNATQTRSTITDNGRWQVVNGTPEFARNIMLLDTQTGNSWITCTDSKGVTSWCTIPRGYEQVGNSQSSSPPTQAPNMPKCLRYVPGQPGYCAEFEK